MSRPKFLSNLLDVGCHLSLRRCPPHTVPADVSANHPVTWDPDVTLKANAKDGRGNEDSLESFASMTASSDIEIKGTAKGMLPAITSPFDTVEKLVVFRDLWECAVTTVRPTDPLWSGLAGGDALTHLDEIMATKEGVLVLRYARYLMVQNRDTETISLLTAMVDGGPAAAAAMLPVVPSV